MSVHVHQLVHATAQPQELSILTDPKEQRSGNTSGQNPNAGWYNRFVQSGKSDHETKTNGCFGGRVHVYLSPSVSHRRLLQPAAVCCSPYDCVCCRHTGPSTCIYICICTHIHAHVCVCDKHPPQDSMCRSSAARSPATCTRPHASSGCRGSGVIRVAWQRLGHMHHRLLLPSVHDMHPSMPTHHD